MTGGLVWVIFFFGSLDDARDFYSKVSPPKVIGQADTWDYGSVYFVSVGRAPRSLREIEDLCYSEWCIAREYKSYRGHESALTPTDVHGFKGIILGEM